MIAEEIRLDASHHQFYVQDSTPRGSSGDADFWDEDAYDDRLATGDGLVAIGTGTYGIVKVRAELHPKKPSLDLAQWDHVTECSLKVESTRVLIMGCLSTSGLFFNVTPGVYRVRACHANLAESEDEARNTGLSEFRDWYVIQFWPAKSAKRKVLKRRE
jgi:hypothetical protein